MTVILVGLRGKKKLGSISRPVSAVGNIKQNKTDGKNGKCGEWGGIIFTLGDRKASSREPKGNKRKGKLHSFLDKNFLS